ncbi:uncharacterized protein LOC116339984 isoform X2 [Contarinia nasturtii]|uniref:uncharacterized protein LOC116339984 isoform X2 n=1 Tax=Contarinia nasturtii TaxID=265458 RepID=UPI0012D3BB56|nr:uncharacterized protein LOC116339984 isoform X2 [Contarinia nasturtii]
MDQQNADIMKNCEELTEKVERATQKLIDTVGTDVAKSEEFIKHAENYFNLGCNGAFADYNLFRNSKAVVPPKSDDSGTESTNGDNIEASTSNLNGSNSSGNRKSTSSQTVKPSTLSQTAIPSTSSNNTEQRSTRSRKKTESYKQELSFEQKPKPKPARTRNSIDAKRPNTKDAVAANDKGLKTSHICKFCPNHTSFSVEDFIKHLKEFHKFYNVNKDNYHEYLKEN